MIEKKIKDMKGNVLPPTHAHKAFYLQLRFYTLFYAEFMISIQLPRFVLHPKMFFYDRYRYIMVDL